MVTVFLSKSFTHKLFCTIDVLLLAISAFLSHGAAVFILIDATFVLLRPHDSVMCIVAGEMGY